MTKYDYSKRILSLKNSGQIDEAIDCALEAKEAYPQENIFEKFLGDMYVKKEDYANAGNCYIEFLKKLGDNKQYFKHFAKFLQIYVKAVENKEVFINQVEECLANNLISNTQLVVNICKVIAPYIEIPSIEIFEDDKNLQKAINYIHQIKDAYKRYILYFKILELNHSQKNKTIDKHVVSSMEKEQLYQEALELIVQVLKYDQDQVAVRTLFRICRKINDYSEAERYLEIHPNTKRAEQFNILYELVFYYSKIGDIENRNEALKKIEKCGKESISIMRTLYNFYLQFGMLDNAAKISTVISQKNVGNIRETNEDRKEQEKESTEALLEKFREMILELEHSRKLISMSELLKGFSHELGQPITNIRYGIQLFQMKMDMGIDTKEELETLFQDVLGQLYRIKEMLQRFSPITSEKNASTKFSVAEEIKTVFKEFSSRLSKENIEWSIEDEEDFYLNGDNVKFDQIFYNLIGNSIYAIKEKGEKGNISVKLQKKRNKLSVIFEDNGIGIQPEYRSKIFEPFFTTKDCSTDENGGGEGLGLYIIWNIVRMFNGDIVLDKSYENGARFVITINKSEREKNE